MTTWTAPPKCAAYNKVEFIERSTIGLRTEFMRPALAALLVFGFLVWDMSKNHGQYTRSITASLDHAVRQVSWR